MRSTVRQLITGVAVAVALSAVGVGAIGGAVAQSPQRVPALAQDGLVSGYNAPPFAAGGRLVDRQQLQHYFLDGSCAHLSSHGMADGRRGRRPNPGAGPTV
jgi:hypothetical protein